jgi:hypothetical protein
MKFCAKNLPKILFLKNFPNLNNLEEILKNNLIYVLNDKIVLASILNLGAILKCHAWQHWFYCLTIKSL